MCMVDGSGSGWEEVKSIRVRKGTVKNSVGTSQLEEMEVE